MAAPEKLAAPSLFLFEYPRKIEEPVSYDS